MFVVSVFKFYFFRDKLGSNTISFEVIPGKLPFIFDRSMICKRVIHIDQWDNSYWPLLGFNALKFSNLIRE